MAKRNPTLDLHWLLYKRDHMGRSRLTGGDYWRLYFVCVQTQAHAVIDVDSTMKNFAKWQHIITDENPYGLYTNLKQHATRVTKHNDHVITADSEPECLGTCDHDPVLDEVEELYKPEPTHAQKLFDFA